MFASFSKYVRGASRNAARVLRRTAAKPLARRLAAVAAGAGVTGASYNVLFLRRKAYGGPKITKKLGESDLEVPDHSMPEPRPDLPTFSLEELRKHNSIEDCWTHFKGAVYDITDMTGGHPGGKPRLLMAGGGDLETYWEVYPEQHLRGHVVPWMDEKLRIGNLAPADVAKIRKEAKFDNYYKDDPERHPDLLANTHHPFNGEPRMHLLTDSYLTPNELFYVRLHLNVPDIDPDEYELQVRGLGVKATNFSLQDIKSKFPKVEQVVALQCAGNRREDFHHLDTKIFIGPHWVSSAFSCAKWGGARMRDVLAYCGLDVDGMALGKVKNNIKHICFESYDATETGLTYGGSVPVKKVVDPFGGVMVAYEMNGEDIPRDHGYPVRALVPGHAGARSAKFLHKIICSQRKSQRPWQIHAYRAFSPDMTFQEDLYLWHKSPKVRLDQAQIVQQMPVQSLVCNPPPNSVVGGVPDEFTIKGVAHGWGKGIARVDVSIDDGDTWTAAEVWKPEWVKEQESYDAEWAWHHFYKTFKLTDAQKDKLRAGKKLNFTLASKAVDGHMNVQPFTSKHYYNARGICINHVYRSPIVIDPKAPKGVHIPKTGPGAYEGFGNVPSGGKMSQAWKVSPWNPDDFHTLEDTFNNEKDTSSIDTSGGIKTWN